MDALGEPIDLGTVKVPAYIVGAINDHLTPWKSTYRTSQLLSGDCTFGSLQRWPHREAWSTPRGTEGQLLQRTS